MEVTGPAEEVTAVEDEEEEEAMTAGCDGCCCAVVAMGEKGGILSAWCRRAWIRA